MSSLTFAKVWRVRWIVTHAQTETYNSQAIRRILHVLPKNVPDDGFPVAWFPCLLFVQGNQARILVWQPSDDVGFALQSPAGSQALVRARSALVHIALICKL